MTAKRDTYANLFTYGPTNNSGVMSILAFEPQSPSPIYEWIAAYCAEAAKALSIDPARPLQTLTLDGVTPAPKNWRFNKTQTNALAGIGLAVQMTNASGVPTIAREQTTYQKNTLGQADNAYELMTTLATLAELFRRMRQAITNKYPRHKLANNGTRFGPGQAIVTPNIIKAELVAEYRQDEYDGLVENGDAFKKFLMVERDDTDPNRVNVLYPPDVVNQLRMFAVLAQFRLQYPVFQNVA
jgi:phage tail sheath gpL-like